LRFFLLSASFVRYRAPSGSTMKSSAEFFGACFPAAVVASGP
jgi:hypothetical protein